MFAQLASSTVRPISFDIQHSYAALTFKHTGASFYSLFDESAIPRKIICPSGCTMVTKVVYDSSSDLFYGVVSRNGQYVLYCWSEVFENKCDIDFTVHSLFIIDSMLILVHDDAYLSYCDSSLSISSYAVDQRSSSPRGSVIAAHLNNLKVSTLFLFREGGFLDIYEISGDKCKLLYFHILKHPTTNASLVSTAVCGPSKCVALIWSSGLLQFLRFSSLSHAPVSVSTASLNCKMDYISCRFIQPSNTLVLAAWHGNGKRWDCVVSLWEAQFANISRSIVVDSDVSTRHIYPLSVSTSSTLETTVLALLRDSIPSEVSKLTISTPKQANLLSVVGSITDAPNHIAPIISCSSDINNYESVCSDSIRDQSALYESFASASSPSVFKKVFDNIFVPKKGTKKQKIDPSEISQPLTIYIASRALGFDPPMLNVIEILLHQLSASALPALVPTLIESEAIQTLCKCVSMVPDLSEAELISILELSLAQLTQGSISTDIKTLVLSILRIPTSTPLLQDALHDMPFSYTITLLALIIDCLRVSSFHDKEQSEQLLEWLSIIIDSHFVRLSSSEEGIGLIELLSNFISEQAALCRKLIPSHSFFGHILSRKAPPMDQIPPFSISSIVI